MTAEDRIAQLERKLQYLMDRQEILDCVSRHARGCDRHDVDVLAGAYHPDGIDEHGFAINPGPQYPAWANAAHNAMSQQSMHNITTHLCEIEGDTAYAESYAVGLFLDPDGQTARMIAGRYADRLERREGQWKIALRRSTVDILMTGEASLLNTAAFHELGYVKGMRDRRDVTYQRPLTLEDTPADRW